MIDSISKQDKRNENGIFGSFYIGDIEFAVSVSYVQEVVNAPSHYTSVPLSENYLMGLFNLRGKIVPVLNLREMFGFDNSSSSECQKVAIIGLNGICVGFLFDDTGEIFRSREEERSDFDSENTRGLVCGVFKKENGKRIVQILDVTKLYKLKNIPKEKTKLASEQNSLSNNRGSRRQCISFDVGPARCALPISDIQEILKLNQVIESALSVGNCIGTIDLRGTVVPVIDFASLLDYRETNQASRSVKENQRIIVMKLDDDLFGLLVDSVESIISYFSDELLIFPILEQKKSEMLIGCITGQGKTDILLLNHQKILSDMEINEITRGHSKLYSIKKKEEIRPSKSNSARSTYITFEIDRSYAVSINEVKEIIEFPDLLIQPPGLNKNVMGLLNLRGELFTIIDGNILFKNSMDNGTSEFKKILIFRKIGLSFGLVVNAVDAILSFSDKDKVKLPEILIQSSSEGSRSLISEAIEYTESKSKKIDLLIVDVDSIANTIANSKSA